MQEICIGDINMLAKICVTPNVNTKICVTPKQTPNSNRWDIGQISRVGNGDFVLFVLISFGLGNQREPSLQWNMGFILLMKMHQAETESK